MNRLKEVREEKGYTQKEISKMLEVDQSNYSKYELEKISIPVEVLKKLSAFYRVSIDYLLFLTDKKKPYPKSDFDPSSVVPRQVRTRRKIEKESITQ